MFPAPRPDSYNHGHYIDLIVNIEYMPKVIAADQQALLARNNGAKPVPGVLKGAVLQKGARIDTAPPDAFPEGGFGQVPATRRLPGLERRSARCVPAARGGAGGHAHAGKTAIT